MLVLSLTRYPLAAKLPPNPHPLRALCLGVDFPERLAALPFRAWERLFRGPGPGRPHCSGTSTFFSGELARASGLWTPPRSSSLYPQSLPYPVVYLHTARACVDNSPVARNGKQAVPSTPSTASQPSCAPFSLSNIFQVVRSNILYL